MPATAVQAESVIAAGAEEINQILRLLFLIRALFELTGYLRALLAVHYVVDFVALLERTPALSSLLFGFASRTLHFTT